jgi:hypothetical protein
MAFTVNFGVAPLLFLQVLYGHLIYTSSILMAVYWLSVVFIIIAAYYFLYIFQYKYETWIKGRTVFLGSAVVLILVVAFFFVNNMVLMTTPENWAGYFADRSGTLLPLTDPTLVPRYLHFVTASVAVGGLFLALCAKWKTSDPQALERVDRGMKWFAYATCAQLVFGTWYLISLPREIMLFFMGGNALATILLLAGLALVGLLLVFGFQKKVWAALYTLIGTMAVMALMRDMVRTAYLKGYFHPSQMEVKAEYGPMILFAVSLAVGLVVVVYMLKLGFETHKEVSR